MIDSKRAAPMGNQVPSTELQEDFVYCTKGCDTRRVYNAGVPHSLKRAGVTDDEWSSFVTDDLLRTPSGFKWWCTLKIDIR